MKRGIMSQSQILGLAMLVTCRLSIRLPGPRDNWPSLTIQLGMDCSFCANPRRPFSHAHPPASDSLIVLSLESSESPDRRRAGIISHRVAFVVMSSTVEVSCRIGQGVSHASFRAGFALATFRFLVEPATRDCPVLQRRRKVAAIGKSSRAGYLNLLRARPHVFFSSPSPVQL